MTRAYRIERHSPSGWVDFFEHGLSLGRPNPPPVLFTLFEARAALICLMFWRDVGSLRIIEADVR